MVTTSPSSLFGKKVRVSFKDGPMAGKAFDHTFRKDGSVTFGAPDDKTTSSSDAAVEKLSDGTFIASYMGPKGFTLTLGLNLLTGKMVAYSSDGKTWSKQKGRCKMVAK